MEEDIDLQIESKKREHPVGIIIFGIIFEIAAFIKLANLFPILILSSRFLAIEGLLISIGQEHNISAFDNLIFLTLEGFLVTIPLLIAGLFLLRNRLLEFIRRSILFACVLGIISNSYFAINPFLELSAELNLTMFLLHLLIVYLPAVYFFTRPNTIDLFSAVHNSSSHLEDNIS